mmetsp:Transcript_38520/g.28364  ORF Transcript_38520/g.28364 Transcript_38520/m.28364 type:complete len:166 (-) Transcript_38520:25-522(-)
MEDIDTTLIPEGCNSFINNSTIHGMQIVLGRYFETMKVGLATSSQYPRDQSSLNALLNSKEYRDLYLIQFIFVKEVMRTLAHSLQAELESNFQSINGTSLAGFIIFLIILTFVYLLIGIPLVSKLNKEIWRTKAMLTIIPMEVILRIERIQEFLASQTLIGGREK